MNATVTDQQGLGHELRFESLFSAGRGYAFPCDADGHIDIDAMAERTRISYFYARTVIGRELSMPRVCRCAA